MHKGAIGERMVTLVGDLGPGRGRLTMPTPVNRCEHCCSIARALKSSFGWASYCFGTGATSSAGGAGVSGDSDQVLLGQQTEPVGGDDDDDDDTDLLQRMNEGVQVVLRVVLLLVPQLSQTFQDRLHGSLP